MDESCTYSPKLCARERAELIDAVIRSVQSIDSKVESMLAYEKVPQCCSARGRPRRHRMTLRASGKTAWSQPLSRKFHPVIRLRPGRRPLSNLKARTSAFPSCCLTLTTIAFWTGLARADQEGIESDPHSDIEFLDAVLRMPIVPILYREVVLDALGDFSDFLESISCETSRNCQARGSNPDWGAGGLETRVRAAQSQ